MNFPQLLRSFAFLAIAASAVVCACRTANATELRRSARVKAVENTLPSVVNIHTEKPASEKDAVFNSSKSRKINGMGTGIVLDERGYIVTNYHVVADVDTIRVTFMDGSDHLARTVSFDREHDLAVVKVDTSRPLKVITFGTSSDLMLAEDVIAIGNAMGYRDSVSKGIISQLSRDVEVTDTQSYKNLIQTDAAINPGNSGGPLLNIDGEVIGINVAIRQGAQRIGFAIPIDDARTIIARLMSTELLDHAWHGVVLKDMKCGSDRKLIVDKVTPDSPAAAAGLKAGDVIVKAGTVSTIDHADFERALLGKGIGGQSAIVVKRQDQVENLSLTLAPQPSGHRVVSTQTPVAAVTVAQAPSRSAKDDAQAERAWKTLGLRLTPLSAREQQALGDKYRGGLRVADVKADGTAARNGIRRGDVLVGLHKWETTNFAELGWILGQPLPAGNAIQFLIVRGADVFYGQIQVASTDKAANG